MSIRDNNRQMSEHAVQCLHSETFAEWFQDHVSNNILLCFVLTIQLHN